MCLAFILDSFRRSNSKNGLHQVDFLRTKLIDDAKRSNPQYRGLVHGTMSIVKQEGIFGIYRGLFPVVMVDLYTSLKEGVYVCIDDASRS